MHTVHSSRVSSLSVVVLLPLDHNVNEEMMMPAGRLAQQGENQHQERIDALLF
jgi:hypothetical protein